MAVIVLTEDPAGLLKSMKEEMRKHAIDTWSVDSDGDFWWPVFASLIPSAEPHWESAFTPELILNRSKLR